MYELAIVGGGPAAVAAAVYAGRKQIKTILITESFGGQSLVSSDIQNWIGESNISGIDLAKKMEDHVKAQGTVKIKDFELVNKIEKINQGPPNGHFALFTESGASFEAKTILLATGSRRRRLGVPGEDEFDGKGVVFCSTCDAPLFKDKTVAIVGGGNAGLEAVVDSIPYANKIYLLVRSDQMKGDKITQDKIISHPKVKILFNSEVKKINGDKFVTSINLINNQTNEESSLEVQGVFVEIGAVPNSDFAKNLVEINKSNEVLVDHKTQATTTSGIWAAGDVSDVLYKQNNISAGDGVKALLSIYEYLHKSSLTGAHGE